MEDEDAPRNTDDEWVDLLAEDDDAADAIPPTTFLGAVGQFVAALLAVALLIALFIGGALVFRWIFG